jgi:hypothetical protein
MKKTTKGALLTSGKVNVNYFEKGMDYEDEDLIVDIEKDYVCTKYGRTLKIKSCLVDADNGLKYFKFYGKDQRGDKLVQFSYDETRITHASNKEDYIQSLYFYELEMKGIRIGTTIAYNENVYTVESLEYREDMYEYRAVLKDGCVRIHLSTFDITKEDILETPYTLHEIVEQTISKHTAMFGEIKNDSREELIEDLVKLIESKRQ